MSLTHTAEFDAEVTARVTMDNNLALYTGIEVDVLGQPIAQAPQYAVLGSLIDLTDESSLRTAIWHLDQRKQSIISSYNGANLVLVNAKRWRFGEGFKLTAISDEEMAVNLCGAISWAEDGGDAVISLTPAGVLFPNGQVAVGGRISIITIGRIAATFQVIGGIELIGKRLKLAPCGSVANELAIKRVLVFPHTGADQGFTVQAGETVMEVELWGAGGSNSSLLVPGGSGGYTWGAFAVATSQAYAIMVGSSNAPIGAVYGFGGAWFSSTAKAGGGLTGLFSGSGAILATDAGRALAIAGGGGAPWSTTIGGHGNDQHAQHTASFQGDNASAASGGGGGGYAGGQSSGAGRSGSGYLAPSKLRGETLWTTGGASTDSTLPPRGIGSARYVAPAGFSGSHGYAVVVLRGP